MSVDPGVLDANILAYAIDADAPQHAASRALLETARDPATSLYVTAQISCESLLGDHKPEESRSSDPARRRAHHL